MLASPRAIPAKRKSAGPVPRAEELGFRPLFGVEDVLAFADGDILRYALPEVARHVRRHHPSGP